MAKSTPTTCESGILHSDLFKPPWVTLCTGPVGRAGLLDSEGEAEGPQSKGVLKLGSASVAGEAAVEAPP
jgi:hypothetical protein